MSDSDKKLAGGCLVILLVIGLIAGILFIPTHSIRVPVVDTYWVHEQQVENYIPRRYGSWKSQMPGDAYDITESQRVSSVTHTCWSRNKMGGCTLESSTNHYSTWADYTADRWGYERSQVVNGNDNNPLPFWPTPDFHACAKLHCERAGITTERYVVTYRRDDGRTFTCDTTAGLYGEFRIGQHYELNDGLIVHIPRCDTLKSQ